jgi:uncharacterized spore protein YtfJ
MTDERFDPAAMTKAAEDTLTVRRVFGEAYEREGVLVVPVAKVCGLLGTGSGGGEGEGFPTWSRHFGHQAPVGASDETAAPGEQTPGGGHGTGHGGGGGYGARVKPLGVYVVDDAGVHFRPAVDANRVLLGAQLAFAIVASTAFLAAAVRRRR